MTDETMLKIDAFCDTQQDCDTCPINSGYKFIDPSYPGELFSICDKMLIEMTPEEEQIVLTIIEREEAKNARA